MIQYDEASGQYQEVTVTPLSDEYVQAIIDNAQAKIAALNAQIAEQQAIIDGLSKPVADKAEAVAIQAQAILDQPTKEEAK